MQGAGQAGQAMSPRMSYPISHSFVAPGGTRWDTVGRLLPKSGNTRTHSESDRDATGCYWALGGRCMSMP